MALVHGPAASSVMFALLALMLASLAAVTTALVLVFLVLFFALFLALGFAAPLEGGTSASGGAIGPVMWLMAFGVSAVPELEGDPAGSTLLLAAALEAVFFLVGLVGLGRPNGIVLVDFVSGFAAARMSAATNHVTALLHF
jgi:hypothetical protein